MQLSFKSGKPVAQVCGGPMDGQLIYIDQVKDDDKFDGNDPIELLGEEFFRERKVDNKRLKVDDLIELSQAIKEATPPKNPKLITLYNDAMKIFDVKKTTEFKLSAGILKPVPEIKGRQCLYTSGPSGAGKSTHTSSYAQQWRALFPDNPIYLFSSVAEDKALDKLHPIRIALDPSILENKLQPADFKNSLVIFDDIDVITDKKVKDEVFRIQDQLLQTGRHTNTYVISTSHTLVNYNKTKIILGEAHQITVFPNGTKLNESFKRFLEKHCSFDKKCIAKIEGLKTRWITVNKSYPQYVLYETGIFIC